MMAGNREKPRQSKATIFLKVLVALGAAWVLGILKAPPDDFSV